MTRADGAAAPTRRALAPGDVGVLAGSAVAGVALAALWALLAPGAAQRASSSGESAIAADGVLVLLGLAAGLVTAAVLALRPGARPGVRTAVVLAGSLVGGLVAWRLGAALGAGAPEGGARAVPHPVGAALVWPLVAAAVTAVRVLVPAGRAGPGR